jgi:hypothetical protein
MWSLWVNPFHPAGGKWHPVRIMAPDPPAPPGELLVSRRGPRPALPSSIIARTRSRCAVEVIGDGTDKRSRPACTSGSCPESSPLQWAAQVGFRWHSSLDSKANHGCWR